MSDRTKGLLNISANFEPQTAEPFDGRLRVKTKDSLIIPATWESSDGNIYTYKGMIVSVYEDDDENNGIYFLKEDGYSVALNWEKISGNFLESNIIYYVDGDDGYDGYDGLTWSTAKKTFTFLRTIPKFIGNNSILQVYARGTIRSSDNIANLQINNFFGDEIQVIGVPSDVATGFTPTGWDNTVSSWSYHAYIDVSTALWTVNEHQGRYIQITGDSNYYPILSNTATRLYSTDLPNLSGANTFKIVEMPIVEPELVSNPGVAIDYSDDFFEVQSCHLVRARVSNFRFNREGVASPSFWLCDRSNVSEAYFTNLSMGWKAI